VRQSAKQQTNRGKDIRNRIELKRETIAVLAIVLTIFESDYLAAAEPSDQPLQIRQTIPLPGVEGRIDHFACDTRGARLFICALGNNSVEVIDLRKGERIHSITGLGSPQGVGYVAEINRLFVANDKEGLCRIYDATSFQPVSELSLGDDADNVRIDDGKIYVGFGSGGIAVVNAADGKQTASIKLAAHPEAFVPEKNGRRIFANVPNAHQVAVIDRDKKQIIATWKTDSVSGNFPITLDEANHRLFVGCRRPAKLLVLNSDSGEVVAKIDISSDPDDLFYDGKRRRIYAICGEGFVDVIEQSDADHYNPSAKIATAPGARTGLLVPESDELFVALPRRNAQSAEIRRYRIR
jgi:DNA-binding beta-propeller fold protein YncE